MNKRSQAALEFLSTYAWAFVVIAITLGALYYSGIFDFAKYLPQKCLFPLQFKCLDFAMASSTIRVKLINNLGEDIKVDELSITNDATIPIACVPPATPFDWLHATEYELLFTGCTGGGYLAGERAEVRINMVYHAINTPSRPSHLVTGKINGKVTS